MDLQVTAARRLLAVMAALLAVYLVLLAGQRAVDGYRARQEVTAVRKEIDQLRSQNINLQMDLRAERQDEEIERVARGELGMVQPGDRPVVLLGPTATPRDEPPPGSATRPQSHWQAWLHLFTGAA